VSGSIEGALLLIAAAFIWICKRRRRSGIEQIHMTDYASSQEGAALIPDDQVLYDGGADHMSDPLYASYFDTSKTLDRSAVTLDTVIGSGNFGKVYIGTVRTAGNGSQPMKQQAAIKQPRCEAREEFQLEMETMSKIEAAGGHRNIVKVLGCVYGADPLLALELCARGSLKIFLTQRRTDGTPPALVQLTGYGLQVAQAMVFLEAHKLLHRDLAARNVLMTEDGTCKLADFGLSRNVGHKDYYRRGAKSAPIPIRWMAPETLAHNVSTIESDRWSFAVLLWEIYSLCSRPYAGVANYEILEHISEGGHRLGKPAACPLAVYHLMKRCWSVAPKQRPPFAVISGELSNAMLEEQLPETHGGVDSSKRMHSPSATRSGK
jgi:serine/threonine protein kinase